MGFSPRDVDTMTLWEFACCSEGFRKAHETEKETAPAMNGDELAALGIEGFE